MIYRLRDLASQLPRLILGNTILPCDAEKFGASFVTPKTTVVPNSNSITKRDGEDPGQREVTADAPSSSENLPPRLFPQRSESEKLASTFASRTPSRTIDDVLEGQVL